MTNSELFQQTLEAQYVELFANDPEYVQVGKITTPKALAWKMTVSLAKGGANKDGEGIKRTCKTLGIAYTYKAIGEFLR